jgi:hypothetical protein
MLKKRYQTLIILVIFGMIGLTCDALAQDISTNTTNTALGMGDAVRGSARSNTALAYNPAGMSLTSAYSVDSQYYRLGANGINQFGMNIVDSQTRFQSDRLALGASYQHLLKGTSTKGYEAKIGLSKPIIERENFGLSLGVAGKYRSLDQSPIDQIFKRSSGFNLDVGAMLAIASLVQIGVVAENLIDVKNVPRRWGGGVALVQDFFTIDVDYLWSFDQKREMLAMGTEFLFGSVVFRGGYQRHEFKDRQLKTLAYASGGIAYVDLSTGGQFAFAYRANLDQPSDFMLGVSLSFGVNFGNMSSYQD